MWLPRCLRPVGWMPEKIRTSGGSLAAAGGTTLGGPARQPLTISARARPRPRAGAYVRSWLERTSGAGAVVPAEARALRQLHGGRRARPDLQRVLVVDANDRRGGGHEQARRGCGHREDEQAQRGEQPDEGTAPVRAAGGGAKQRRMHRSLPDAPPRPPEFGVTLSCLREAS